MTSPVDRHLARLLSLALGKRGKKKTNAAVKYESARAHGRACALIYGARPFDRFGQMYKTRGESNNSYRGNIVDSSAQYKLIKHERRNRDFRSGETIFERPPAGRPDVECAI